MYFLKINGSEFPLFYMVPSSYRIASKDIIIDDYYDAGYNRHIIKSNKKNITISFRFRKLKGNELKLALGFFNSEPFTIEFFNPKSQAYATDYFKLAEGWDWGMDYLEIDETKWYEEIKVELVRCSV